MTRDLASKKDEQRPSADSPLSCKCLAEREATGIRTGARPTKVACAGGHAKPSLLLLAHGPGSPLGPFPLLLVNIFCVFQCQRSWTLHCPPQAHPSHHAHRPLFASTPAFLRGAGSLCLPPLLPTPTLAQPKCFLPPSFAVMEKLSNSI